LRRANENERPALTIHAQQAATIWRHRTDADAARRARPDGINANAADDAGCPDRNEAGDQITPAGEKTNASRSRSRGAGQNNAAQLTTETARRPEDGRHVSFDLASGGIRSTVALAIEVLQIGQAMRIMLAFKKDLLEMLRQLLTCAPEFRTVRNRTVDCQRPVDR
jgi:hypothetical protein